jgi:hypothetical protein
VEIALGGGALLVGGRPAALGVAGAYVAFALVVGAARRRGAESCGCFGAADAPPGPVHVAVDLGSAAVALLAAVPGPPSLGAAAAEVPLAGVPYLLALALGTWLVVTIDTVGAVVAGRVTEAAGSRAALLASDADGHTHDHGHDHGHTHAHVGRTR